MFKVWPVSFILQLVNGNLREQKFGVDSVQKLDWRSTETKSREIRSVDRQHCACPPGNFLLAYVYKISCPLYYTIVVVNA